MVVWRSRDQIGSPEHEEVGPLFSKGTDLRKMLRTKSWHLIYGAVRTFVALSESSKLKGAPTIYHYRCPKNKRIYIFTKTVEITPLIFSHLEPCDISSWPSWSSWLSCGTYELLNRNLTASDSGGNYNTVIRSFMKSISRWLSRERVEACWA